MVHADISDQLIMMTEGDCYQNDKYSKVLMILRIVTLIPSNFVHLLFSRDLFSRH